MTLPLSAADVLGKHVVFELDCIARMYGNLYVPRLTHPGGAAAFHLPPGGDVRLDGAGRPDQQGVRGGDPPLRRGARHPDGAVREGSAQRRRGP